MEIKEIRATMVTVPLQAPLRHSVGCHWGRFVRTLVEVEADNGLIGYDRDPLRPDWFQISPDPQYANPYNTRTPDLRSERGWSLLPCK